MRPGSDHRCMALSFPWSVRPAAASRAPAWLLLSLLLSMLPGCAAPARALDSEQRQFDHQSFRIVRIDLRHDPLSLHWRDPSNDQPYGSIESLRQWGQAHGRKLLFAANAGIYDRQAAPLGLFVEQGKTRVPLNLAHGNPAAGNFSLQPNGVFAIYPDGHAAVRRSTDFKADQTPVRWATQSGPMLLIDGRINPQFEGGSDSVKWRSGVCASSPHQVVFAVSEGAGQFPYLCAAVP